jgi:hypothetical protein
MASDWSIIEQEMIQAAEAVVSGAWPAIAGGATAAIKALSTVAQAVAASTDMTDDEKKQLLVEYQQSLRNTMTAYASITFAVAQNAVNAAITVLIKAVPALAGFV